MMASVPYTECKKEYSLPLDRAASDVSETPVNCMQFSPLVPKCSRARWSRSKVTTSAEQEEVINRYLSDTDAPFCIMASTGAKGATYMGGAGMVGQQFVL
jgi:hypothetical protein